MKQVKAKVIKINKEMGYMFVKTNTKKHDVFVTPMALGYKVCLCQFEVGQIVKVAYKDTERGLLATTVN